MEFLEGPSYTDCLALLHSCLQRSDTSKNLHTTSSHRDTLQLCGCGGETLRTTAPREMQCLFKWSWVFLFFKRKLWLSREMPYFSLLLWDQSICYMKFDQSYRHWFWSLVIMFEVIIWTGFFLSTWKYFSKEWFMLITSRSSSVKCLENKCC